MIREDFDFWDLLNLLIFKTKVKLDNFKYLFYIKSLWVNMYELLIYIKKTQKE